MVPGRAALLGVADVALGERLAREVERFANQAAVTVVSHLSQLRDRLRECTPRAILLDESILQGVPLIELLTLPMEPAMLITSCIGPVTRLITSLMSLAFSVSCC